MNDAPQTATTTPREPGARHGFTLVELLVVILIIGMLAGLLAPAVMRALTKSRNAAIKAEIDMLHMAIMNYKNEYGSFPPGLLGAVNSVADTHRSATRNHLRQLFPRANLSLPGDTPLPSPAIIAASQMQHVPLSANAAASLIFWLEGYTRDPTTPLVPVTQRKRLFDFDRSRIDVTTQQYAPPGKSESPYIYIPAALYAQSELTPVVVGDKSYKAIRRTPSEFFNPDTFQLLCAGRDGIWHEDVNYNGVLDPGEDLNANGMLDVSEDDLSNFWPGTRREYIDSLNQ